MTSIRCAWIYTLFSLLTVCTCEDCPSGTLYRNTFRELKNCTSVTSIVIAGDNVTIMIQGGSAIPIISVAADPRTIRNTSVLLMDVSCSGENCSSTVPWFSSSSSSAFIGLNITAQNVTAHMEKVDKGVAGLIHIYSHRLQNITLVVRNCNIRTNTTPIVVLSSDIATNVSVNVLDSHIEQQSTANFTAQYGCIYLECFVECAQFHTAISRANLAVRRSVYAANTSTSNSLRDATRASWRLLWISVKRGSALAGSINVEFYDSVISSEFVATTEKVPVNVKFVILLLDLDEYDKGSQLGVVPVTIVTDIRRNLFDSSGIELILIYVDVDDVFTRAVHLTAKVSDSTMTLVSNVMKSEQPAAFQRSLTPIFVGTLSMHSDAILLVSNVQATWKMDASQAAVAISDATVLGAAVCFAPKYANSVIIDVLKWNLTVVIASSVIQPMQIFLSNGATIFPWIFSAVSVQAGFGVSQNTNISIDCSSVTSTIDMQLAVIATSSNVPIDVRVLTALLSISYTAISNATVLVRNVTVSSTYSNTTLLMNNFATMSLETAIVDWSSTFAVSHINMAIVHARQSSSLATAFTKTSHLAVLVSAIFCLPPWFNSSSVTISSLQGGASSPAVFPFAIIVCSRRTSDCWVNSVKIAVTSVFNNDNVGTSLHLGAVVHCAIIFVDPTSGLRLMSSSSLNLATASLFLASSTPYSHVISGRIRVDKSSFMHLSDCNVTYLTPNLLPLPTSLMKPFALRASDLSLQYRDNPTKNVIIGCNVLNGAPLSRRRIGVPTWMLSHVPQYSQRLNVNCTAESWGNDESSTVSSTKYVSPELYPGVLPTEDAPDAPSSASANAAVTVATAAAVLAALGGSLSVFDMQAFAALGMSPCASDDGGVGSITSAARFMVSPFYSLKAVGIALGNIGMSLVAWAAPYLAVLCVGLMAADQRAGDASTSVKRGASAEKRDTLKEKLKLYVRIRYPHYSLVISAMLIPGVCLATTQLLVDAASKRTDKTMHIVVGVVGVAFIAGCIWVRAFYLRAPIAALSFHKTPRKHLIECRAHFAAHPWRMLRCLRATPAYAVPLGAWGPPHHHSTHGRTRSAVRRDQVWFSEYSVVFSMFMSVVGGIPMSPGDGGGCTGLMAVSCIIPIAGLSIMVWRRPTRVLLVSWLNVANYTLMVASLILTSVRQSTGNDSMSVAMSSVTATIMWLAALLSCVKTIHTFVVVIWERQMKAMLPTEQKDEKVMLPPSVDAEVSKELSASSRTKRLQKLIAMCCKQKELAHATSNLSKGNAIDFFLVSYNDFDHKKK